MKNLKNDQLTKNSKISSTDLKNSKKDINLSLRINSTVLTNLQRGNVKTQQCSSNLLERSIYELAAQGELSQNNIKNFINKLNEQDSNGLTALIWAANYGQLATCKLLLENKADILHKGKHGETALMFAAANGHYRLLKLLLNFGSIVNDCDEDGNTALIYAAYNNHETCVKELLKNNADLTIQNINFDTAYSIAIKNKSIQSKLLIENFILNLIQ